MTIFANSVILSGRIVYFCVILYEIDKVTGIGHECDFTIFKTEVKRDSVKC